MPLSDQQNQHNDDPKDLSFTPTDSRDYMWNYVGCSQIVPNVPNQTVPLFNPQLYSNPEPHSGLFRHWCAEYAASSSFGQSPDVDRPVSAVDAQCQFPINDHSFQQTLLPWPQPKSTAELNPIPVPYGDTNYQSSSSLEQALTAGDALATQRLGESHSNPQKTSRRCVKCWALRKPVIPFI